MYHSVLKDPALSGKYIITPSCLENDLKYIKEKGYTSISMEQLISYVYEGTPLPEKPIILTFDDGHYNNLGYVVPLLEKYDMKAIVSVVGKYTDTFTKTEEANFTYGYLRWEDIASLMENKHIEFGNHTYNLHSNTNGRNGCAKKYRESTDAYQNLLANDLQKLQDQFKEHTSLTPTIFTYPFGSISKDSTLIIKQLGFKASLSCASGINYITQDPDCLYQLRRNNRPSFISSQQFFKKILD